MNAMIKKIQGDLYADEQEGRGFFIALTAESSKGQEGAPIRYEAEGKWHTIGVVTKGDSDVYNADDDNKEDYDYDGDDESRKFTIGNLLTKEMIEEWIEPKTEAYSNMLVE